MNAERGLSLRGVISSSGRSWGMAEGIVISRQMVDISRKEVLNMLFYKIVLVL